MKKKYLDRLDWIRVTQRKYTEDYFENDRFKGYTSLIWIEDVTEPLYIKLGEKEFCIVDKGYKWLQFIPVNELYAVTVMYDVTNNLIQWYFDIIKSVGRGLDRVYFEDMYLDIVYQPKGDIYLLDEDELAEAYKEKVITKHDVDVAYKTYEKIRYEISTNQNYIINTGATYFEKLMKVIEMQ